MMLNCNGERRNEKVMVDLVGFASLVPIAMLYNWVEREWGGLYAMLAAAVLLIPVSVVWRYYYLLIRRNDRQYAACVR